MTKKSFSIYEQAMMIDLIERLNEDYYKPIETLVGHVGAYCDHLKTKVLTEKNISYISSAGSFMAAAKKFLTYRNNIFIPYLKLLTEKDTTGHDCQNCSGKCEVQHGSKIMEFMLSIKETNDSLLHMRSEVFEGAESLKEFEFLIYKVILLGSLFEEVLQVEEEILLDKIRGAQKNIHAVS